MFYIHIHTLKIVRKIKKLRFISIFKVYRDSEIVGE